MPLLSLLAAPAAAAAIAVTADHADPPACRPVDAGIQVAGAGRDAVEAKRPAVVRLPRPEPPAGAPQPSSIAPPPAEVAPQQGAQQSAQEIAHEGPRVLIWAIGHESSGVPEEWAAGEGQPGVHYCSCSTEDVERLAALVAAEKREGQVRMGVWMWVWVCKCGMRRMPPFQCAGEWGWGVCAWGGEAPLRHAMPCTACIDHCWCVALSVGMAGLCGSQASAAGHAVLRCALAAGRALKFAPRHPKASPSRLSHSTHALFACFRAQLLCLLAACSPTCDLGPLLSA